MRQKYTKIISCLCVISIIALNGCSKKKQNNETAASKGEEQSSSEQTGISINTKNLENGSYYVVHQDGSMEPLYFGNATFEQNTIGGPSNDRVVWFKEDKAKIPTMFLGDTLIYYSQDQLTEIFNIERFEDFGPTVGICGITPSQTGRLVVSTDSDSPKTYPGSDADGILGDKNAQILIDTVGGKPVRTDVDDTSGNSTITRIGTIKNLDKDKVYPVQMYSGTEKMKIVKLKADVDAMGSMETFNTSDYNFQDNLNIITINFPDFMASGYYMIGANGMFKYLKGNPSEENELMKKINTPTPEPDEKYDFMSIYSDQNQTGEAEDIMSASNEDGKFQVLHDGPVTIHVALGMPAGNIKINPDGDFLQASMQINAPDGSTYPMEYDLETDTFTYHFDNAMAGDYTITYYNLEGRVPTITAE